MRQSLRLLFQKMTRTYNEAIEALNSLQSNAAVIESIRKSGGKGGDLQLLETLEYLERIGYKCSDLDKLNVLHITGTKGKGSTSAFTSSLLQHVAPHAKIGLYTSPHLVAVRERIRINGKPIPEDMFARYFWQVWDRLEQNTQRKDEATPLRPAYFRYMTLLAFHVFLSEKVDATVLEVGVGGTYDSTNIVPQPIVTGVTSLGIDHIFVLGRTLPEIAHQKGGIYKPGVPAFAVDQPEGLDVLRSRAAELKASSFTVVPVHPALSTVQLGLAGKHQQINASLAVAMVNAFLTSSRVPTAFKSNASENQLPSDAELPKVYIKALEEAKWPGRCQIARPVASADGGKTPTYYLDGAHTVESLQVCADWFADALTSNKRALIFNCTSGRSANDLLTSLLASLTRKHAKPFDCVIFCTNTTYSDGHSAGDLTSKAVDEKDIANLTVQHELADAWKELTSNQQVKVGDGNDKKYASAACEVLVEASIEGAIKKVTSLAGTSEDQVDVLVTGSLHLVGGTMAVANLPVS